MAANSKRICLIIPTLNAGGMERVMSLLANHLVANNHQVTIVLMFPCVPFFEIDSRVKIITPGKHYQNNFLSAFMLFYYLRSTLKKLNPDTVLSFGERYNSYVLLSALGLRFPVYISDRSSPLKKLSKFYIRLSNILYPFASGIIAQTNAAAGILTERIGKKTPPVTVIPNPVRSVVVKTVEEKENIVLLVGRLVTEKRYDRLLEIAAKADLHSWKFLIVGDGPLRSSIESNVIRLNLESKVILTGSVANVDEYFSKSKIFALTSDSEGFPNSLCEAMAHGLACIAFDCIAGPSDIIEDRKNGVLVKDGEIDLFVDGLNKLMSDEDYRYQLGINAGQIREKLSPSVVLARYEKFILGLS